MAECLFKAATTHSHPGPDKNRQGVYQKGDFVIAFPDGKGTGKMERLPHYVRVKLPGLAVSTIKAYADMWRHEVSFEIVAHNAALDGYRVKVSIDPATVKTDGTNGITRAEVENYLNRWNAEVYSIAVNEVIFDAGIYNAVKSEGFWGRDVSLVNFSEDAYDQETGVHQIYVDWSAAGWSAAKVRDAIEAHGGEVVGGTSGEGTFNIGRESVFREFKEDVRVRVDNIYCRRRWHISDADVDAIASAGGEVTRTAQQLLDALLDKVSE